MATALHALVPVKRLSRAKQRLASVLSQDERGTLARAMLCDVLEALAAVPDVTQVWVVSTDDDALAVAKELRARPLPEQSGSQGLNAALAAARERITGSDRPAGLLVVPADLPCATTKAFRTFLAERERSPLVRIAGADDGGTNALLLQPPAAIPFSFGPGSAAAHEQAARSAGIRCERRDLPELSHDVDRPGDLRWLLATGCGRKTAAFICRVRLGERLEHRGAHP